MKKAIKIGQVNNYPTILASAMNETRFFYFLKQEKIKRLFSMQKIVLK